MSEYDVAQICLNGHVITESSTSFPEFKKNYCTKCGSKTITECPSCNSNIRGRMKDSLSLAEMELPKYCDNCGNPYPWTENILAVSNEYIENLDSLSEEEKAELIEDIKALVSENPRTPVAKEKVKKKLSKMGKEAAQGIRDILIDLVSETIRKTIWGP